MSRIGRKFEELNRPAFIAFTVAGDPDRERCIRIAETLVHAGADILELGVPFTDPVADGPTIQRADGRALGAGTDPDAIFDIVRAIRTDLDVPLVLLTYYNIVYRRGVETFYREAASSGVDGILIVDMPFEESAEARRAAEKFAIDQIFMVAPTTSDGRLRTITDHARGFLYLVSVLGVSGARERIGDEALDLVRKIKPLARVPIAVGFGISRPEHVGAISRSGADAFIVGSAIVDIIEKYQGNDEDLLQRLREYISRMSAAGREGPSA
jgi:tryptophan synthase alpha chain